MAVAAQSKDEADVRAVVAAFGNRCGKHGAAAYARWLEDPPHSLVQPRPAATDRVSGTAH
ncbi:MAG: hypothetical protein WEE89_13160 [Gemmatimonadota bacterium]